MKVAIIHKEPERKEFHVATVAFLEVGDMNTNDALNYAFRATQNINGSWSQGEFFDDGERNYDFDENITVMKELPVIKGKTYGLRSTMYGDQILVGNQKYMVDFVGFRAV